jgi:MSHA biogenesis protein MshP
MRRQRGFALMLAIFLVVTLAAMGVYLLTISTGQIEAAVQDEQATRAHQAARSGIDWGAYQMLRNSGGAFATACTVGGNTQTLVLGQGLANFFAEVHCQQVGSEAEAGATVVLHRLRVTGCNSSPCCPAGTACGPTYVERQLQLILAQ